MTAFPGFIIIIIVIINTSDSAHISSFCPSKDALPGVSHTGPLQATVTSLSTELWKIGAQRDLHDFVPLCVPSRGFLVKIGEERLCEKQVGKSSVMLLQMTRVDAGFSLRLSLKAIWAHYFMLKIREPEKITQAFRIYGFINMS